MDTDKRFCSILFDVMQAKGVTDIVCSPGSRNAPLLIAAASREGLRKHVVIDERSAAFMALGMAIVSRKPVALICTSGTALLNYGPAIAEAFYQSVPLVVISADRPEQWIDQDDSQTLRQFEAFSNYVKKSYQLPAWGDREKEMLWYANRVANDAMIEAESGRKGPVHINIQLGEPLNGKTGRKNAPQRIIDLMSGDSFGNKEVIRSLASQLAEKKVMLVCGFMPPDARLQTAVSEFMRCPNVVVMSETISNLHLPLHSSAIDTLLTHVAPKRIDWMAPDIILSIGGSLVSRKLKEYLRRNTASCEHWAVGWNHTTSDCFMSLTKRLVVDPGRLLHQLAAALRKTPLKHNMYAPQWCLLRKAALEYLEEYVEAAPWSELKAFRAIFNSIPSSYNLFLSNGTSVRYAQIFSEKTSHASYCNRGVSGIDGSVSTAIGGAKTYKGPTVMVTGDMSMAYDINALSLPDIPDRMKIIVMDNQGGGIFRFIPTTSDLEERDEFFCAAPNLPLEQLAAAYGWEYREVSSEAELTGQLTELFDSSSKRILKVSCPPEVSAQVLKELLTYKEDEAEEDDD